MSAAASSAAGKKKKQKSNVKKKHQDEWDEILKFIRLQSRELGLPIGSESNGVIKLFEEYAEDNAPFPPKQLLLSRPLEPDPALWMRILSQTLVHKSVAAYCSIFATKSYKGLRALCVWGVDIGDEGCAAVCEALPLLPHCIKLELMDCGLGVKACEHLGTSLKHRRTTHLKILRLDHNGGVGAQGVARLSEGLYFNSLLHTLSLAYCNIQREGGVFLQNILMTKDIGLKTLNLEGNGLGREGVMHVAQGIANNRSLTSLNLSINSFGGEGDRIPGEIDAVRYLVSALSNAKQLTSLQLDGNLIGDAGMQLLHAAAVSEQIKHVTDLTVTPFADSDLYRALSDRIEANKPVKKKTKKKRKSTKKK